MITYINDGEYLITLQDGREVSREVHRPIPYVVPLRKMTKLAFKLRFTDVEAIDIDLASIGTTRQAAGVRRAKDKTDSATYIDPTLTETRNGVLAMEAAGFIAAGRALIILDSPILDTELYHGP
jgi:hypothetical protein